MNGITAHTTTTAMMLVVTSTAVALFGRKPPPPVPALVVESDATGVTVAVLIFWVVPLLFMLFWPSLPPKKEKQELKSDGRCALAAADTSAATTSTDLKSQKALELTDDDDITPSSGARRHARVLAAAHTRMSGLRLILENLEDNGNRAAIMRSAEALGLLHVHEVAGVSVRAAPAHKQRARTRAITNGGEKWLMTHRHASAAECASALHDAGFLLCAAVLPPEETSGVGRVFHRDACSRSQEEISREEIEVVHDLEALDFGRPLALCFGNERFGVSDQMRAECDMVFTIRLRGLGEGPLYVHACGRPCMRPG